MDVYEVKAGDIFSNFRDLLLKERERGSGGYHIVRIKNEKELFPIAGITNADKEDICFTFNSHLNFRPIVYSPNLLWAEDTIKLRNAPKIEIKNAFKISEDKNIFDSKRSLSIYFDEYVLYKKFLNKDEGCMCGTKEKNQFPLMGSTYISDITLHMSEIFTKFFSVFDTETFLSKEYLLIYIKALNTIIFNSRKLLSEMSFSNCAFYPNPWKGASFNISKTMIKKIYSTLNVAEVKLLDETIKTGIVYVSLTTHTPCSRNAIVDILVYDNIISLNEQASGLEYSFIQSLNIDMQSFVEAAKYFNSNEYSIVLNGQSGSIEFKKDNKNFIPKGNIEIYTNEVMDSDPDEDEDEDEEYLEERQEGILTVPLASAMDYMFLGNE